MKNALMLLVAAVTLHAQTANNPILQRLGETDLPTIHTQKSFSTLMEFPAGQKIVEVTIGDKEFWVVENSGGRFLHVKPAKENIVTNLNVLMEGDIVYAFILREVTRAGAAKESADLLVRINPGEDPAKLRSQLAASTQENASVKESLAQLQQIVTEMNQKHQVEKELQLPVTLHATTKDENCKTVAVPSVTLQPCGTAALVSPPESAPTSSVTLERCSPSGECRSPAAQPIRGPWSAPTRYPPK